VRFEESRNINKSLMNLGQVIKSKTNIDLYRNDLDNFPFLLPIHFVSLNGMWYLCKRLNFHHFDDVLVRSFFRQLSFFLKKKFHENGITRYLLVKTFTDLCAISTGRTDQGPSKLVLTQTF